MQIRMGDILIHLRSAGWDEVSEADRSKYVHDDTIAHSDSPYDFVSHALPSNQMVDAWAEALARSVDDVLVAVSAISERITEASSRVVEASPWTGTGQATAGLSPLVQRQLEEIVLNSPAQRLWRRITQFGEDAPGQEPVSDLTRQAVRRLVDRLHGLTTSVSATVSGDGTLALVAVFPDETRLYVEVERDGSVEAAVTREKRYAQGLPVSTVTDLTLEVIRAAIGSIGGNMGLQVYSGWGMERGIRAARVDSLQGKRSRVIGVHYEGGGVGRVRLAGPVHRPS